MIKKVLQRFLNGFCYSIAITMIIHLLVMYLNGGTLMLPEFVAHFDNELKAYMTELILIGIMSGITSGGTVVFETKRIGLVLQSILFLCIMLSAWVPVACYVWGFHKYTASMVSTIISIVVTYGFCFFLQLRHCRAEINDINARLRERRNG
ncbi:MAG: DUF3021 family protein [Eubacteriales bacterium]|nr:DUF3021 family protein [Eubacteriales bacterium]